MQCMAQSVGRVAGVIDDSPGFPYTPPGVDVLEGGKLTSNNVMGSSHNPLQSFAVASCAVSKQGVLSHFLMKHVTVSEYASMSSSDAARNMSQST